MNTVNTPMPIRVLHVDMPRALTSTIRGFDFRNAFFLNRQNVLLDHVDLGTAFWKVALKRAATGVGLEDFFAPRFNFDKLSALNIALTKAKSWLGFSLTPFGVEYGQPVNGSKQIQQILGNPTFCKFVMSFIDEIKNELKLDDPNLRIISIGVDSANSLAFGGAFAHCLRSLISKDIKVILGKHSYENFSLALRKSDVKENGFIESQFDHVIFHEEHFAEELLSLLGIVSREQPITLLGKITLSNPADEAELLQHLIARSHYLALLRLPPELCPVLMPLSRNKCYWKKCSFCVQIKKHLSDRYYDEHAELANAFSELKLLANLGFRYVIFNDEAISPANLRRLCDFLENELPNLHWTVRIIADTNFKPDLVQRMKQCGCFEVLFGLETVSEKTAQDMNKVSSNAGEEAIYQLLKIFSDAKIGIFLNIIYAFPTESNAEFSRTLKFLRSAKKSLSGITTQMNKFALFYGSDLYLQPEQYAVRILDKATSDNDLQIFFNFEDQFSRTGNSPGVIDYFAESLDMTTDALTKQAKRKGFDKILLLFQLNYASFGLIYKQQSGYNMYAQALQ